MVRSAFKALPGARWISVEKCGEHPARLGALMSLDSVLKAITLKPLGKLITSAFAPSRPKSCRKCMLKCMSLKCYR
jgi:hypothetical protein